MKYSLDNFIVYDGNNLAYLACLSVIKQRGKFNPLFIYGKSGLGKTHLLRGLYDKVREKAIFWDILNLKDILKKSASLSFENIEWIFIDNFQYISQFSSEDSLNFFKIVENALLMDIQIVIASSKKVEEIFSSEDSFLYHLRRGLIVEISPPQEKEVFKKFLMDKVKEVGVELDKEEVENILSKEYQNFFEFEGEINRLFIKKIAKKIKEGKLDLRSLKEEKPSFFEDVLSELEKVLENIVPKELEKEKKIETFKEKIFVWKMKGFNTEKLEQLLKEEKDLHFIEEEFDRYYEKVKKLIELQKEYGKLGVNDPEIEKMLFDPDKVEEIEEIIKSYMIEKVIWDKSAIKARECFEEMLQSSEKHKILYIYSEGRNGKTTLLILFLRILREKGFKVLFYSGHSFVSQYYSHWQEMEQRFRNVDFLIIDDFHLLCVSEDAQELLLKLFLYFRNLRFILSANSPPEGISGISPEILEELRKSYKVKLTLPDVETREKVVRKYLGDKIDEEEVFKIITYEWKDKAEFLEAVETMKNKKIDFDEYLKNKKQKVVAEEGIGYFIKDFYFLDDLIWEEL